ncbi:hypothetical protein [Microbulbifer sp. JMSA003]|uniref:hypothetical protein n=1 Tax=Microbulbifer sp. JMSA003 TaxID=3243369 RepID=UPI004039322C
MKKLLSTICILFSFLPSYGFGQTVSSFCAVADAKDFMFVSTLISVLDEYAEKRSLKRGMPSPNGITYAEKNKEYIINVTPIGPIGTEVSFFPRAKGTYAKESDQFKSFVMSVVADKFGAVQCEDMDGYRGSVIHGYEAIVI